MWIVVRLQTMTIWRSDDGCITGTNNTSYGDGCDDEEDDTIQRQSRRGRITNDCDEDAT